MTTKDVEEEQRILLLDIADHRAQVTWAHFKLFFKTRFSGCHLSEKTFRPPRQAAVQPIT